MSERKKTSVYKGPVMRKLGRKRVWLVSRE